LGPFFLHEGDGAPDVAGGVGDFLPFGAELDGDAFFY
jgi:hypothetical protein